MRNYKYSEYVEGPQGRRSQVRDSRGAVKSLIGSKMGAVEKLVGEFN